MSLAPRPAALGVLILAAFTIGTALVSQYGFGLIPCELCLLQRWPYYVGVPLALLTCLVPSEGLKRAGLALLALLFLVSAGLGVFHAGVEWHLWAGPSGCSGGPAGASFNDFLQGLDKARAVSCTDAAIRVLGLSMAGWNALVSLAIALIAALGATGKRA